MAVRRLRIVDEAPADGQAPLDVVIDGLENGGQSITSVEVSTLFANQPATAELEGTVLKLGIPKGETGPAGAAGQQGPKGDKGDTGAQGPAGADGTSFTKCTAGPDVSGEDAAAAIATVNALLASLRAGGVLNAS